MRPLGAWSAGALVVANMIGTGAFTVTGFALATLGAPGPVLLAWLLGGALAACGALSYGALGRCLPLSGGEYTVLSRTVHPLAGFLAGWLSLVAGFAAPIAVAALALDAYAGAALGRSVSGLGALAIAGLALAHALRVGLGVRLQNASVLVLLAGIATFIAIGAARASEPAASLLAWPERFDPFAFASTAVWVSFAYSGWNAAAYVASELHDPARDLSRALVGATAFVTALYLALNAVFLLAAPAAALAGRAEVGAVAAEALGGAGLRRALAALVGLALVTSISSMLMAGPRVVARMADDGLLPRGLGSGRAGPRAAVVLQAGLALAAAASSDLATLLGAAGFLLGASAAATVLALAWQRARFGADAVPLPGWPLVPGLFVIVTAGSSLALAVREPGVAILGAVTLAAGLPIYWRVRRPRALAWEKG